MRISTNGRTRVLASLLVAASITLASVPLTAQSAAVMPNGQDTVLVVGDSLTVGTAYFGSLKDKIAQLKIWPTVVIDAKVGRLSTEGAKVLSKKLSTRTTAIVVALGTNDMISRRDPAYPPVAIDAVMEQSMGLPVLWCNIEFSPTGRGDWRFRARRFNRALRDAQSRWPNLMIADWDKAFTPAGKSRYIADGVHLNVSGYKTRTTFFINQMRAFGRTIVAATSTTTTTAPSTTTIAVTTTTSVVSTTSPTTTTVPGTTTTSP